MTMADTASQRRLVMLDGDGRLRSAQGERINVISDVPVTLVVLGDLEHGTSWMAWLTTMARRSICFCAADLADPAFQRWLCALPGWEQEKLVAAMAKRGLHLVWWRKDGGDHGSVEDPRERAALAMAPVAPSSPAPS